MKPLAVLFLITGSGLLLWLFMSDPLLSPTAHTIAAHLERNGEISLISTKEHHNGLRDAMTNFAQSIATLWGSEHILPDYCAGVLEESPSLNDALKTLNEQESVYCPGFDYSTSACQQKRDATKQAIRQCFLGG
jgi:hypothetical protein